MSTLPMMPSPSPSCPHPCLRPQVTIPMYPHMYNDETEIVALQKQMDNLREQKHLREEVERKKQVEEEERWKQEEADKVHQEEKRRAVEIGRQQGSGRECMWCWRMALACIYPSWGWGTACNACAAAKQRCGGRGREVEGLERKKA